MKSGLNSSCFCTFLTLQLHARSLCLQMLPRASSRMWCLSTWASRDALLHSSSFQISFLPLSVWASSTSMPSDPTLGDCPGAADVIWDHPRLTRMGNQSVPLLRDYVCWLVFRQSISSKCANEPFIIFLVKLLIQPTPQHFPAHSLSYRIVKPTVPAASACPHFPTASLQPFCFPLLFCSDPMHLCSSIFAHSFSVQDLTVELTLSPGWLRTCNTFVSTLESARITWTDYHIRYILTELGFGNLTGGWQGNEEVIGTQLERSWDWVVWALWWRSGSMLVT